MIDISKIAKGTASFISKAAADTYNKKKNNAATTNTQNTQSSAASGTNPSASASQVTGTADTGANGITASGSNAMTQNNGGAAMTQVPQGYLGVRDTLKKRGIDIDWNADTGMVTYNGKDIYKPESIVDGRSYASEQDINSITNSIYKSRGDELVAATAAAAGTGLENIVQWDDGNVLVGGTVITPKYVTDDGNGGYTAMVSQKELQAALDAYKEKNGIIGDKAVYDDWNDKYNSRIQEALNKVTDREDWDYDPYSDPAYLAYKDQYEREGNRAYQDAYASMAANAGGYGSSAAATAAGQQLNYYQQQLNDRVPELMQNSWNRYVSEQDMNRQALNSIINAGNEDYNKLYTANNDAYNRANEAANTAYNRRLYEQYQAPLNRETIKQQQELTKQYGQQTQQGQIDTDYYKELKQQEVDRGNVEISQLIENLNADQYMNAFNDAYQRGYFLDSEAAVIGYEKNPEKYDTTNGYPNPREGAAMSDLYYWRNYGLVEFDDQEEKKFEMLLREYNLGM